MRRADESARNECLGQARVNVTAQFAARARVFAELERIIADAALKLYNPPRE
jgi:hypothetical protein